MWGVTLSWSMNQESGCVNKTWDAEWDAGVIQTNTVAAGSSGKGARQFLC